MFACDEFSRLTKVIVKRPADAFRDDATIDREWRDLAFTERPDLGAAVAEHEQFLNLLIAAGAEILALPEADGTGLDSLYARDASIVCPAGLVPVRPGKPQRRGEPAKQGDACRDWGVPVLDAIQAPGRLEGGDVVWFDERTLAVGRGYRTDDDGIRQLRDRVGAGVEVVAVPLPHWKGPGDVFHLMSVISPVDRDLAVVYSPLLPVPFREWLIDRGIALVEVPDDEFATMGANVLAVAPRVCVMLEGNPETRKRLERAGADVRTYCGVNISLKGGGGPTCLTRPITRASGG